MSALMTGEAHAEPFARTPAIIARGKRHVNRKVNIDNRLSPIVDELSEPLAISRTGQRTVILGQPAGGAYRVCLDRPIASRSGVPRT
jgi:hypothetical protein